MSLRQAYMGARVLETSANYARADDPLWTRPGGEDVDRRNYVDADEFFWHDVLRRPDESWGSLVTFRAAAFCEWVARVPGLFWKPESRRLRQAAEGRVEEFVDGWRAYTPEGKSEKVMGGIGTFRLPPALDGTRLVTLTTSLNASAGVPAVISPDVWDKMGQPGPREGRLLEGQARWHPMAQGWAARFKSTRDIPRGYLVLSDPDQIEVSDSCAPVLIHPFTVMEYRSGTKELFDYVYATGDTSFRGYRQRLSDFFDRYRDWEGRYGRYLLAGDMVDALWEAEYSSPAELRRADLSAESQLELLQARVQDRLLGEDTTDRLLDALGAVSTSEADLRRLSDDVLIPPDVWLRGGSLAEMRSQFVYEAVRQKRAAELVEVIALLRPAVID